MSFFFISTLLPHRVVIQSQYSNKHIVVFLQNISNRIILRIYLLNKKTLNLHFSYIIMYKSCHVRLSSDPHVYYIGKTGYVRPHIQRMSKLTHIGIFRFKLFFFAPLFFLLIASLNYLIIYSFFQLELNFSNCIGDRHCSCIDFLLHSAFFHWGRQSI